MDNTPVMCAPEALQGTLERYSCINFRVGVDAEGCLRLSHRYPELLGSGDFEDEAQLHEEQGQQGLNDLLLALAPYLDEPLILQAADFDSAGEFYRAAEWTVRPGATAVEYKEIVALGDM